MRAQSLLGAPPGGFAAALHAGLAEHVELVSVRAHSANPNSSSSTGASASNECGAANGDAADGSCATDESKSPLESVTDEAVDKVASTAAAATEVIIAAAASAATAPLASLLQQLSSPVASAPAAANNALESHSNTVTSAAVAAAQTDAAVAAAKSDAEFESHARTAVLGWLNDSARAVFTSSPSTSGVSNSGLSAPLDAMATVFGSATTGLAGPGADLDVLITLPYPNTATPNSSSGSVGDSQSRNSIRSQQKRLQQLQQHQVPLVTGSESESESESQSLSGSESDSEHVSTDINSESASAPSQNHCASSASGGFTRQSSLSRQWLRLARVQARAIAKAHTAITSHTHALSLSQSQLLSQAQPHTRQSNDSPAHTHHHHHHQQQQRRFGGSGRERAALASLTRVITAAAASAAAVDASASAASAKFAGPGFAASAAAAEDALAAAEATVAAATAPAQPQPQQQQQSNTAASTAAVSAAAAAAAAVAGVRASAAAAGVTVSGVKVLPLARVPVLKLELTVTLPVNNNNANDDNVDAHAVAVTKEVMCDISFAHALPPLLSRRRHRPQSPLTSQPQTQTRTLPVWSWQAAECGDSPRTGSAANAVDADVDTADTAHPPPSKGPLARFKDHSAMSKGGRMRDLGDMDSDPLLAAALMALPCFPAIVLAYSRSLTPSGAAVAKQARALASSCSSSACANVTRSSAAATETAAAEMAVEWPAVLARPAALLSALPCSCSDNPQSSLSQLLPQPQSQQVVRSQRMSALSETLPLSARALLRALRSAGRSGHHGAAAAGVTRALLRLLPALRPLTALFKALLASARLNIAAMGGLTSYTAVVLCAAFLLRRNYYNNNDDNTDADAEADADDVGVLFVEFLYFYGHCFDPRSTGVALQVPGAFYPLSYTAAQPTQPQPQPQAQAQLPQQLRCGGGTPSPSQSPAPGGETTSTTATSKQQQQQLQQQQSSLPQYLRLALVVHDPVFGAQVTSHAVHAFPRVQAACRAALAALLQQPPPVSGAPTQTHPQQQ